EPRRDGDLLGQAERELGIEQREPRIKIRAGDRALLLRVVVPDRAERRDLGARAGRRRDSDQRQRGGALCIGGEERRERRAGGPRQQAGEGLGRIDCAAAAERDQRVGRAGAKALALRLDVRERRVRRDVVDEGDVTSATRSKSTYPASRFSAPGAKTTLTGLWKTQDGADMPVIVRPRLRRALVRGA